MLERIEEGRTDLVFDWIESGGAADARDARGVSLIRWCAYYGDVSAIRFLVASGAPLHLLGDNFDFNGAAFHGHWQLTAYLLERGADPNHPLPDTGETPLHVALTKRESIRHERVVEVLLAAGADPDGATAAGVETGAFMRDVRTCGETALHRAAAYGTERTIRMLLEAGARVDARDANADSALSWASRALRSTAVLRLLCFPPHDIRPDRLDMEVNLIGRPGEPRSTST